MREVGDRLAGRDVEGGARGSLVASRLIALALLGCLLFGYPLLEVFNVPATILGIPVIYAYLFGAWAGLILLVALAARRSTGAGR